MSQEQAPALGTIAPALRNARAPGKESGVKRIGKEQRRDERHLDREQIGGDVQGIVEQIGEVAEVQREDGPPVVRVR